ncbi:MAG: hypothetical protein JRG74_06545 [Deltaproteobacteria bacterium]|nr:hypothetical protein [Deltaproteobacteria bacterium]
MISYRLIGLSVVLLVFCCSINTLHADVSALEFQAVTVWGESASTNDPALDKRLAIAHARRKALEEERFRASRLRPWSAWYLSQKFFELPAYCENGVSEHSWHQTSKISTQYCASIQNSG